MRSAFTSGRRAEVVDRPAHVEDVLPRHALAGDHVAEELESLEVAAAQVLALPLAEAQGIGAEDDVSLLGQRHAGVVHGTARQAGRLDLAQVPRAVVLVPDGHGRGRMVGIDAVGHQQQRRHAVARLDLVGDRLDAVAVLADRLANHRPQVARLRPRPAQALEQFLSQVLRCCHVLVSPGGPGEILRPGRHRRADNRPRQEAPPSHSIAC